MATLELSGDELKALDEILTVAERTLTKTLGYGDADEKEVALLERLSRLRTKLEQTSTNSSTAVRSPSRASFS